MKRISAALSVLILSCSPALAGFEWVPPSQNPEYLPVPQKAVEAIDAQSGFAQPPISAMPLAVPAAPAMSSQRAAMHASQQKRNLSGRNIVIDPYPLRNSVPSQDITSITDMYKEMNQASANLNPVQLGNGMKTFGGVRGRVSVPPPEKMAIQLPMPEPVGMNTAMTPMIGGEPEPMHAIEIPQEPIMNRPDQGNLAHAIGFGRELPLALALSQVVPSEYNKSYAQNVDTEATVSWEGGKPWNIVLNEMLRPADLTAVVSGRQVVIQPLASL